MTKGVGIVSFAIFSNECINKFPHRIRVIFILRRITDVNLFLYLLYLLRLITDGLVFVNLKSRFRMCIDLRIPLVIQGFFTLFFVLVLIRMYVFIIVK